MIIERKARLGFELIAFDAVEIKRVLVIFDIVSLKLRGTAPEASSAMVTSSCSRADLHRSPSADVFSHSVL